MGHVQPVPATDADAGTFCGPLEAVFEHPPRDFSPTPLWWWSGEEVTDERLIWQMRRFADAGVYNLVVINLAPSGPLFGARADEPRWFSEHWWQRFETACETAASLGMRLWLYDQIGFSGANVQGSVTHRHPWAAGRTLRNHRTRVTGGRIGSPADETLLAAYDTHGARIAMDGDRPAGVAEGTEVVLVTTAPTAFDYLNPAATEQLLDAVHHEFDRRVPQHLGSVIAGSFQDELPNTNAWTERFPEEFRARRGYDLLDHLPSLFGRGSVGDAKVRSDYYAVRAELTEEALFEPLAAWHGERGMLLGADQSNPARAGLPLQSTQIYTDYPRTHRHYSAVGSDHQGDSKFHASLARLYGHDRVWLEAFHSSGWGGTLEDTWDWLLPFVRSGATLYNPHATYYSTVGGWFEWAPPSTDWRQPYWAHYKRFADAVARVMAAMTWGRYEAEVAVLHPTATMQASVPLDVPVDHFLHEDFSEAATDVQETQRVYLELVGKDDWFHFDPSALDRAGLGFDIVDDDSVQRAAHTGGRLDVAGRSWTTVLVPSAVFLEEATARALHEHLDGGGRVVLVGSAPRHTTGRDGDDRAVLDLVAHPRCEQVADVPAALAALQDVAARQHVRATTPVAVRRDGDVGLALVGGTYPNASGYPLRDDPALGPWDDHDFDRRRYESQHTLRIDATVSRAQAWNPATGRREEVAVRVDGATSELTVETGGAPMTLVVWKEGARTDPATGATPAPLERSLDLSTGWAGVPVPTMDNSWGDLARPVGRPLDRPQIWALEVRDTDGGWRDTSVTQGQRARVLGPVDAGRAPAPLGTAEAAAVVAGERPLTESGWAVQEWSASRGRRRSSGLLGNKGRVPDQIVVTPPPAPGEEVAVRTVLATAHRGAADLVLTSAGELRAWWNGQPLELADTFTRVVRVDVSRELNLLEYRVVSASRARANVDSPDLESSFSLFPPGGYDPRPEHVVPDLDDAAPAPPHDRVVFTRSVPDVGGIRDARLVVGSVAAATVLVDGEPVARQEKAEYYESEWGSAPGYFTYDIASSLRPGSVLAIEVESAEDRVLLWVDLFVTGAGGSAAVVSDGSWTASLGGLRCGTRPVNRLFTPHESCYAVTRPHLLPEATWLEGPPVRGTASLAFDAVDTVQAESREFRVLLPSGAGAIHLPLAVSSEVTVDGATVEAIDGVVRLPVASGSPAVLEVRTGPSRKQGAAVWTGPVEVELRQAPIALGDWRDLGLGAWSGGVRYSRRLEEGMAGPWRLDLGAVRGSVEVHLDGVLIGAAFCAPFRFDLPAAAAGAELEVTVLGTLGPFLHESTPTTWVFPSQLRSGLLGPVTARF